MKATWDMIRKRFADMENASKAPPPAAEPVVAQPGTAPVPQQQAPPTVARSAMAPPVLAPSVVTEAAAPTTDALDLSVNK